MKHLFLTVLLAAFLPIVASAQNMADPNLASRPDGSNATDDGSMQPFMKNVANPYCCGNKIPDGQHNADALIEPTGEGAAKSSPTTGAGGTDNKK